MNQRHRLPLLALILGGFALRLYRLGAESLWYDETVSVVLARKPIPDLVAHTAGDIHPPGYYLLLHFWNSLTNPTLDTGLEFLFAWPSLFFGLLILPLLYKIGSRIHTPQIGLIAVLLAAINPFHLWYSQEVRMYTLGAALGLVCLWSLLNFWADGNEKPLNLQQRKALVGYVLAAAVGLYSLYYFAFTLVGLNVIAVAAFLGFTLGGDRVGFRKMGVWVAAQIAVILLWGPWIPTFWRQATDPPVPPWRVGWTLIQFFNDILESFSALVVGQSGVDIMVPLFAAIGIGLLARYMLIGGASGRLLLLYLLVPISAIYLLTATVAPLYHVRYLFTYAPVFMIIVAAVLVWIGQQNRWVTILLFVGLIAANVFSLARFWQSPDYRADDHRGTVVDLANRWRPSDLILVNAGWAYTVLETYWPSMENGGAAIHPPVIAATQRLLDVPINDPSAFPQSGQLPLLVRSGSVNATENLGWGNPKSDFFAITKSESTDALNALADCYRRIWHYRIYDTVSDPNGAIRDWLTANGTLQSEQWISGRDLGQLQLYKIAAPHDSSNCEPPFIDWTSVDFGEALRLTNVAAPIMHTSGQILYVTLEWQPLPTLAAEAAPLSMSLRLYADTDVNTGTLSAQQDETPSPDTTTWLAESPLANTVANIQQTLALPIPAEMSPGRYSLELIVYRPQDGMPLPLPEQPNTIWGQRLQLTQIDVVDVK